MQDAGQQQLAETGYVMPDGSVLTEAQFNDLQRKQLDALYREFTGMRDRWVEHRAQSGVESRWRAATNLYYGDQDRYATNELTKTLKEGPASRDGSESPRSRVVVNIVRPKVDQAVAKICEILFPVDDRNWAIKPTPIPELAERIGNKQQTVDPNTGQATGLTADDEAQAVIQAAKEAADKMQKSIDDNLTECQFNGESRKIIEDGVRLGTGIMKGPFPRRSIKKAWLHSQTGTQLDIKVKIAPASCRVDPWDVFFDPACGNDHQRGRGVFHRQPMTRKELRDLVGIDGYDSDAIKQVLRESPRRVRVAEGRIEQQVLNDDSYEMWEYHGEIEPEQLEKLTGSYGDPLKDVTFCVLVMVNDKIIGAMKSWVPDRSLPYDVWCWRKADDSPFGYGLPDEQMHQQRVINSAWRQVMDNARISMGGQIVMRKGVTPQNGKWDLTPNKLWIAKDDTVDITKVFATYEFNSHVQELLAVAQAALNFSDNESGMPQLMGGEKGGAPDTVGGMIMLFNNATTVLRQRVKLYDDAVTRPHIGRYYDFKMATDSDVSIKGDFDIDARGSSALLERDIQNQAIVNLVNVFNMPRYAPMLKEREELKTVIRAFRFNPDELMKTEDQIAQDQQNQQPQQDPRIAAAQLQLQAKQMDIQDRQAERQADQQKFAVEQDFKNKSLEYNKDREQAEYTIAQTDSAIKRDLALQRENNALTISREANAAKERLGTLKIETSRQIFNAEANIKARMGTGI